MYKKLFKTFSIYLGGIIFWIIIISVLRVYCIFNLPLFIDGLWNKKINDELSVNFLGSVAYQFTGLDCNNSLIYIVHYYPEDMSGDSQNRTLTSLIDLNTWHMDSSDDISITYLDKNHRYVLYNNSDGVSMKVFDL